MDIQAISSYAGLILQFANIIIIGYGLYKFLNKPHDTLEEKIIALEKRIGALEVLLKDIQKSLDASHEKHREQDKTNKVFKRVFILLANFEVAYCQETGFEHTEDLKEAKRELEDYLAGD